MKTYNIANAILVALVIGSSIAMFMQASNGRMIELGVGISIRPKDLGRAFIFLALLVLPFSVALRIDAKKKSQWVRFAPIASLAMIFLFPLRIDGQLWSYGDDSQRDLQSENQVVDAYFGYIPFWEARFGVTPPFDRYETMDSYTRELYIGNGRWGRHFVYGLNDERFLGHSDEVYECIFEETYHVLGFYWRDVRGSGLEWAPEVALPIDKCRLINRPAVGSEMSQK